MKCVVFALLCTASLALWQALTVHFSYGGNWTALYCTGALFKPPPDELRPEHIYIFANSNGYDGQVYHYIAHDPFFRRGFWTHIDDDPGYRYRRILVPGLAFLLAFGRDGGIDAAYYAVVWISVFLGAYWLGRFAVRHGYPAWFGLLYALAPAVPVSIDRLTVDIALATCTVGFVLYVEEQAPYALYAVLAAACLARETGLLLVAAWCIYLAGERRWREAAIFTTAGLPAACWYGFVAMHTPSRDPAVISPAIFTGLASGFLHPSPYPFGGFLRVLAVALDMCALMGIVMALAWTGWRAFHRTWTPAAIAMYLFAVLAIALSRPDAWAHAYGFGRHFSPLVLLATLDGLAIKRWAPAISVLAIDPRIGMQMGYQVLNVARGLFG
jgi:hypothetical protein